MTRAIYAAPVSGADDVAPDGSPVPIYRALPAQPEFTPVLQAVRPPMRVLDLGCGVGRLANVLAAAGCAVTAVDESEAMLAHLHPQVQAVRAGIQDLELGPRFDAVVLASHLINVADTDLRRSFLVAAARHVTTDGRVFVQHWEVPDERRPADVDGELGDVGIEFRVLGWTGNDFEGRVVYTLGEHSWSQTFTASLLDDSDLDRELAAVGLQRTERLSSKWLVAEQRCFDVPAEAPAVGASDQ